MGKPTYMLILWILFVFFSVELHAQQTSILKGRVVDAEEGHPLPRANVFLRETTYGAATNTEGEYQISKIPPGRYQVEARMIGYQPNVRTVEIPPDTILRIDFGLLPEPVKLEEIVVEARRIDLLTKPVNVERILKRDFGRVAAVTTADILRNVPGVVTQRTGGWGTKPYIEGMTDSRIIVTVDGARINQACPMGMDACTATVEPDMIESIEVQRGPVSAQYGSGNIGGVINIAALRTPFGTGDRFESGVTLRTRYHAVSNSRIGNVTFGGGNNTFDFNASGGGALHDDYRSARKVIENSGFDSGFLYFKGRYRPSPKQHLHVLTNIYRARDIGWPAANTVIQREKRDTYVVNYFGTGITPALRWLSVHFSAQPMFHDMKNSLPDGTIWRGESFTDSYNAKVESRWSILGNHSVTGGAEFSFWGMHATRIVEQEDGITGKVLNILPRSSLRELGLFIDDEFIIGERTKVKGGLRFNEVSSRGEEGRSDSITPSGFQVDDHVVTGSLALLYNLTDTRVMTLSLSRGFRVATPVERSISAPMLDGYYRIGNPDLRPETNLSTRFGLRGMENKILWNVEIFYNRLSNFIEAVIDPEIDLPLPEGLRGVKRFVNIGKVHVAGASGTIGFSLSQSLMLNTHFTYQWGEDRRTSSPLPQMAPFRVSGTLRYERDPYWIEGEGRFAVAQHRYAVRYGETFTPAYAVVNVRGGWSITENIEIGAGVENIFNAQYREHLNLAQLPEPGRNIYITMNVNLPVSRMIRTAEKKDAYEVVLNVEGMACEFCAQTVREQLMRIPGVVSSDVSFVTKSAKVNILREEVTMNDLIQAIERVGYRVSLPNER